MPPYYPNQKPAAPWTGNSKGGINVSINLDQPTNVSFTNLDEVSGILVVRNPKDLDVDNILVKLEGESRTRLLAPTGSGEKQKPQLEYHKILYKVALVFPQAQVLRGRTNYGVAKNAQTLAPGTHEFEFSFKLPFNNSCIHDMTKSPTMSISGSGIEVARAPTHHVKKTLPPTLSGFPGEAEIRYYLKGTVSRTYFWKENLRAIVPINFFPIEPPRPATMGTEIYARQRHTFNNQVPVAESTKSKMKSIFGRSTEAASQTAKGGGPTVSVDARLPEPAILTCNEDIPLRLIVKRLNEFTGMIHLQSLQVSLVGHTKIRAHEVYRTESNSWIIMSKSNMGIPIGAASDAVDTETVIEDRLWRGQVLPNTVAPSFQACNIERTYQLDVRVGLSFTDLSQSNSKVRTGQIPRLPLSVVLPLRLDLEVYSGIAPPKELLDAIAEAKASIHRKSTVGSKGEKQRQESYTSIPPTPMEAGNSSGMAEPTAQQGTASNSAHPPSYSEAPPSYEDAVASNLPAINAPRPNYAPPPADDNDLFGGDEKRRFIDRRDS